MNVPEPVRGDALLVVDVQNDFLPGGNLAVPEGDSVLKPLNAYIDLFVEKDLPVFATRDWHSPVHCSFRAQGGPWPEHCVVGSKGAQFAADLNLPAQAKWVSKGTKIDDDSYSTFDRTELDALLRAAGVRRLFVGGLATDYCVLHTVKDALRLGYGVVLLRDAVRAVDVKPGDGARAEAEMLAMGAQPAELEHGVTA